MKILDHFLALDPDSLQPELHLSISIPISYWQQDTPNMDVFATIGKQLHNAFQQYMTKENTNED
jgi:hypothetical protein